MAAPKLSKLEFQIMEILWRRGESSIREIQDEFPERTQASLHNHPDHRLQAGREDAVRRVKKVGNFHVFAATVSRNATRTKIDR